MTHRGPFQPLNILWFCDSVKWNSWGSGTCSGISLNRTRIWVSTLFKALLSIKFTEAFLPCSPASRAVCNTVLCKKQLVPSFSQEEISAIQAGRLLTALQPQWWPGRGCRPGDCTASWKGTGFGTGKSTDNWCELTAYGWSLMTRQLSTCNLSRWRRLFASRIISPKSVLSFISTHCFSATSTGSIWNPFLYRCSSFGKFSSTVLFY